MVYVLFLVKTPQGALRLILSILSKRPYYLFYLNRDLQMNGGDITSTEIKDLPKLPFLCGQFGNFDFW